MHYTYAQWFTHVNNFILAILGINAHDMPVQPYREWYDAGMAPGAAALKTIEAVGYHN